MHSEWQSFLVASGARLADGHVAHFGDATAERDAVTGDVLADLSHFGLIAASGNDTVEFLQGQVTNDVRRVDESHSQLNSYCTPKGRILATFRLFYRDGVHYLRMPAERVPFVLKRLRMYILRSQVLLEDASDALARFGIAGPRAASLLDEALGVQVPREDDGVLQTEDLVVVRTPGARFECHGTPDVLAALWRKLAVHARPVGRDAWMLTEIRAGVPHVTDATSEAFVPQMLNLHAINGVSFRKGCYTGQEVVARMQYLGKLKRRMFLAHVDGACPAPGDELFAAETESGQGTGKVVNAQPAPGGGCDLLAVVLIEAVETGVPVRIGDAQGPALQFLPLPYTVDELGGTGATA
ncbi:MAG: folate-binding protein YgfZ [Thiohalomonadaceae bacterium]